MKDKKYWLISNTILGTVFIVNIITHVLNHFYIEDRNLQWHIAFIQVTFSLFFFSAEHMIKRLYFKKYDTFLYISICLTIYFLLNFIGVLLGYNIEHNGYNVFKYIIICTVATITFIKLKIYD